MKLPILKTPLSTSLVTAALVAGMAMNAAASTVANPSSLSTADSGAAGSGFLALQINNGNGNSGVNAGGETSSSNGWSGTADGSLYSSVALVATVDARTYTRLNTDGVTFGVSTNVSGLVGDVLDVLDQTNITALSAAQTWTSTVNLGAAGTSVNTSTNYSLFFNFARMTGALQGVDASLLSRLSVTVREGSNVLVDTTNNFGLLGLVSLTDSNGLLKVDFATGSTLSGPLTVEFKVRDLLGATTNVPVVQDLLDNGNSTDLYRISGLDLQAVPEPSHGMLAMVSLLAILRWRRR